MMSYAGIVKKNRGGQNQSLTLKERGEYESSAEKEVEATASVQFPNAAQTDKVAASMQQPKNHHQKSVFTQNNSSKCASDDHNAKLMQDVYEAQSTYVDDDDPVPPSNPTEMMSYASIVKKNRGQNESLTLKEREYESSAEEEVEATASVLFPHVAQTDKVAATMQQPKNHHKKSVFTQSNSSKCASDDPNAKLMQDVYEAQLTDIDNDDPVPINQCKALYATEERVADDPLSSSAMSTFTIKMRTVTALPQLADAPTQTHLTGVAKMKDGNTQTTNLFDPMEDLRPPYLPLDSLGIFIHLVHFVCVFLCVYACMYACMGACMYACVCICACLCVCMCACVHVCVGAK